MADLELLRSPDGLGLHASIGPLYRDAVFGRDSLEAAEDILHLRPDVVREVIVALARLQGTEDVPSGPRSNEEERGKIHHEHRSLYVGGRRISAGSERLLEQLSGLWGGSETELTYYGSADATPLFVRLVARYCRRYGEPLLDHELVRRDGAATTVGECVLAALDWISRRMDDSTLGLVEFRRRNPNGIPFQVWKDSGTSYLHRDGRLADPDRPLAALEVQAYAYDALVGAAGLTDHRFRVQAGEWRERARALRARTLEWCWMAEDEYFAMGLDRDADGRPRRIDSIASNGALPLETTMLDDLPDAPRYVAGLVRRICSPEFVTEVGIRCRSLSEDHLIGYQDYHGTWAVWMKETFDVVRGLHHQGLPRLAEQVGTRLLNAVNLARANVEFLYVSPDQRVHYDFQDRDVRTASPAPIAGTNVPEAGQAWTVTAALALKWLFGPASDLSPPAPLPADSWRSRLEAEVLQDLPRADLHRTEAEFRAAFDRRGDFVLDPSRASSSPDSADASG